MDGCSTLADSSVPPTKDAPDARLQEFNHRVLNSLTMISSIIGMESRALDDGAGRAALERVRARLVAVSNLYRILGGSELGSMIHAGRYLQNVAEGVAASVGSDERITIEVRSEDCELTTGQAAALGLITNEAMTNAYKHAFTGRKKGTICVCLSEDRRALTLTVADDGCGMAADARDGLGTTLIESLAADLGGSVTVASDNGGTRTRVRFPRLA
jgi:two-component sensor histidine kinase